MKFTAHVKTHLSQSEVSVDFEIDDEDLEGLDEDAREERIHEEAMETLAGSCAVEIWTTQEGE